MSISSVTNDTVRIDFSASETDASGDYTILGENSVDGTYSNASATITALGGGKFRASIPLGGSQGFYRIQRQSVVF